MLYQHESVLVLAAALSVAVTSIVSIRRVRACIGRSLWYVIPNGLRNLGVTNSASILVLSAVLQEPVMKAGEAMATRFLRIGGAEEAAGGMSGLKVEYGFVTLYGEFL
ncbi:unnamed protein product [Vitrella brassicaformis CCMP3155]|uniref:Uncharacterized protein n=1 Tax=Vitrella brassicaformis (strain CCMP3155) TaxID=1169540 RepID=A0A0G4EMN9_VITBC|nr:unnamed protein product [Vitrella brassicaformis CCMP3155]|eukprot:CEL99021.1 unnamed protein product [Vitrella brassicaformis CCMP3155]